MNDFYDDFRRAHIDILIKNIVCNDITHDAKSVDDRPFNIRYSETRKEMSENVRKFLNVSDTNDYPLSLEKRLDMFFDIVSFSFDDMLHLFFEAGMQSGVIFALDLNFMGKSKLIDDIFMKKIDEDKSIIRELLKEHLN